MKIIKYIMLPAVIIIMLIFTVTNSEGLNYWLTWGGNRAAWVYSDSGYIYPTLPIRMKQGDSLKYNGVTVTSGTGGGGIAASDNTTFTGINTFTDSLRANGYSLIDDAKITSYLRVTGEVTTDLNFNKGSSTSIGTISTDSLAIITNNVKRIIIDKNGLTTFTDTLKTDSRFLATDLARFNDSLVMSSYDIFLPNGKGLNWGELTGQIYSNAGELISRSATHTNYTLYGNFLNSSDSTNGFLIRRKLEGYTDTVTSASKWFFSDIVTFTLSPIFSAVVNFPYGIIVTGTATFDGDIVSNGWTEQGGKIALDRYYRDTVLRTNCTTLPVTLSAAHGITNINRIISISAVVKDDSSGLVLPCGVANTSLGVGIVPVNGVWVDATNINIRMAATYVNLDDAVDTLKFYIRYTDYQR